MKKILFVFLAFTLASCGKENPSQFLNVIIQLPANLSKSSGRYDAFLKTVEFMKITAERGGVKKDYHFPPAKWESLFLSELPPIKGQDTKVELSIEVWDHEANGFRRPFPILVGKGSTAGESVRISLRAQR